MKFILLFLFLHVLCSHSSFLFSVNNELYERAKRLLNNDLKIYLLSSTNPNKKFFPEIGNGHVGTQLKKEWIFVNGLYNGKTVNSERARVPSTLNWNIWTRDKMYKKVINLDILIGVLRETDIYPNYNISSTTFACRSFRQILIRNISLETNQRNSTVVLFTTDSQINFSSPDINFAVKREKNYSFAEGLTKIPENNYTGKLPVYIKMENIPDRIVLKSSNSWISFITSIDNEKEMTEISFQRAINQRSDLFYHHAEAWIDTWNEGIIQITEGPTFLIQSVQAAQYYILSSLPFKNWGQYDPSWIFYGMSPEGLAHGDDIDDYKGHIFWDMDIWIYPSVLPFHRHLAIEMMKYRLQMMEAAIQHSKDTGFKGSRYPWESARTGFETSPSDICSEKEVHVSADISFAVQQLLWIEPKYKVSLYNLFGKTIVENVARFWASRISHIRNPNKYDILDVMPPDEYVHSCNNSAFTNIAAQLALKAPLQLAKKFSGQINNEMRYWFNLGQNLSFPVDQKRKLILEHETYKTGTVIKQADVMLLSYPLQIEIPFDYEINSQTYYEKVTDDNGPAMTWAIYSINWFKLKNIKKAESLFQKNYQYINLPFYVWSECVNGTGAINFQTGMGGYLQNILNGFMGMRLDFSNFGQLIFDPSITTLIKGINLHNLKFQGSNFNFKFQNLTITLELINDIPMKIFCTKSSISLVLSPSQRSIVIENQKIIITSNF